MNDSQGSNPKPQQQVNHQCNECGAPIVQPSKAGRKREFCSKRCRQRHNRRTKKRKIKDCPIVECDLEGCNNLFGKTTKAHRFCSLECQRKGRARDYYQRTKGPAEEVWIDCASEWCEEYFKRTHPNQRYCSKQCWGGDMSMLGEDLTEDWGERLKEKASNRSLIKPGQGFSLPYPGRAANQRRG